MSVVFQAKVRLCFLRTYTSLFLFSSESSEDMITEEKRVLPIIHILVSDSDSEFSSAVIAMNSSNLAKSFSLRMVPSIEWRISLPSVDIKDHSFGPNSKIELLLFNSNYCIDCVKKRSFHDKGNSTVFFHFENNKIGKKGEFTNFNEHIFSYSKRADNFIFSISIFKHIANSDEFVNVFMMIGFDSTIELVSFDESQVVTFNGKFICGFRNGDCGTGNQSDNTVGSPHGFIIYGIEIFKGIGKVSKVIDVETWRIDNSRVLRWIVSLIEGNSSVLSTKSSIQNGKCSVLIELMHYFDKAFNSYDFEEKCGAQRRSATHKG
nr:hypothetical protein [Tanacetum cinerariifolium]